VSDLASSSATIVVRPWVDPVIDDIGFDPRSRYVEMFWLGILGPTASWLLRRLVAGLEQSPDGFELDLGATAQAMGLSYAAGRSSPFSKALQRCVMFGLAHQIDRGIAVRRRLPSVSQRHLARMPEDLRAAHDAWDRGRITHDELARAHQVARLLADTGDDLGVIEHRLIAIGISDAVAAEAADNLARLASAW
jgi:hypothetical protein